MSRQLCIVRYTLLSVITDENAAILKDWADATRKLDAELRSTITGRDTAIREALRLGAGVGEIVKLTGVTRARVYQIKEGK